MNELELKEENDMKKTLALVLALVMLLGIFSGCTPSDNTEPSGTTNIVPTGDDDTITVEKFTGKYTFNDYASTISSSWNPFTYSSTDQSYPLDYTTSNLYTFVFNDELNPVDGQDPFTGYKIIPEMAAGDPVDVTEQIKKDHPEFNIPESATSGYAYTIDLNQAACWQDGTLIKAVDYVESMKRLLDPNLLNYRASDWYSGTLIIAGAENYALQGQKVMVDNGDSGKWVIADLTKDANGNYVTPEGDPVYIAVNYGISWCSSNSLKAYVDAYGTKYFGLDRWNELVALMDEDGLVPCNDETLAMLSATVTTNADWGETDEDLPNYLVYNHEYRECDWSNVGVYASGEYQITLVLGKALSGFNFYYAVNSFSLVKTDVYDELLKKTETASGVAWTSTYNTSVETCWSYGPYIMDGYQLDKSMHFTKNENWWGYNDGKHIYKDPNNGKYYSMYMTTDIDCQLVSEVATVKQMFMAGQLMSYPLQSEDVDTYRSSDFCHFTPGQATFFLILNGYMDVIAQRESAADFDKTKYDLETLSLTSFHRALGLCYDKQAYCDEFSPSQSPAFGLISNAYIYDVDTGSKYRDTDAAKQVLCDVYGVDTSKYATLDDAVNSITGYDPEGAKEWFETAYKEAIDAGYITDSDNDGICDQTIKITMVNGATSEASDKSKRMLKWMTEKANEAAEGTGFAGKIEFVTSAPVGDEWSNQIRGGLKDMVMAGWNGSALNPFNCARWWVTSSIAYDANWVDYKTISLTINIDGEDITMSVYDWAYCLNGDMKTVNGKDYNFGEGMVDSDTRLQILAAIEGKVLTTYSYLPFSTDGSLSLLSQKVFYVIEDYNPVMGRGGITYMRYNYDDTEWDAYVASGALKY